MVNSTCAMCGSILEELPEGSIGIWEEERGSEFQSCLSGCSGTRMRRMDIIRIRIGAVGVGIW